MAVRPSYESIFRGGKDYAAALVAAQRVRNVDELDRGGASLLGTAGYYGHAPQTRSRAYRDDGLGARTLRPAAADVTSAPAISYPAADRAAASRRALARLAAQGGEARRCYRERPLPLPSNSSAASAIAPPAHGRRTPQALRRPQLPRCRFPSSLLVGGRCVVRTVSCSSAHQPYAGRKQPHEPGGVAGHPHEEEP